MIMHVNRSKHVKKTVCNKQKETFDKTGNNFSSNNRHDALEADDKMEEIVKAVLPEKI